MLIPLGFQDKEPFTPSHIWCGSSLLRWLSTFSPQEHIAALIDLESWNCHKEGEKKAEPEQNVRCRKTYSRIIDNLIVRMLNSILKISPGFLLEHVSYLPASSGAHSKCCRQRPDAHVSEGPAVLSSLPAKCGTYTKKSDLLSKLVSIT